MNCIVCIKQVPDTNEPRLNHQGALAREAVPGVMNPEDKNALEEALSITEKTGGTLSVLTIGPSKASEVLRDALALGADNAILISDEGIKGSDSRTTAYILAKAIEKIGMADIIFCGSRSADGATYQVGPQLAAFLKIPHVAYIKELRIMENQVEAVSAADSGDYRIQASLPVLLTVTRELNKPRIPKVFGILTAFDDDKNLITYSLKDLGISSEEVGYTGSVLKVLKTTPVENTRKAEIILGSNDIDKAEHLVKKMTRLNIF